MMGDGMPKGVPKGMSKGMPERIGGDMPPYDRPVSAETERDPKLVLLAEGVSLLRRSVAQIPYYKRMLVISP